jgi:hypothetical protein
MPEEYQKELFQEFNKEKSRFEKLTGRISQRRKRLYLNVPLENLIVVVIVLIMSVIVAFAIGVERGKRIGAGLPQAAPKAPAVHRTAQRPAPQTEKIELAPITIDKRAEEKTVPATRNVRSELRPYTIQLVSYKEKGLADKEKARLLKKNVEAFVVASGKWYQVMAGRYKTMQACVQKRRASNTARSSSVMSALRTCSRKKNGRRGIRYSACRN